MIRNVKIKVASSAAAAPFNPNRRRPFTHGNTPNVFIYKRHTRVIPLDPANRTTASFTECINIYEINLAAKIDRLAGAPAYCNTQICVRVGFFPGGSPRSLYNRRTYDYRGPGPLNTKEGGGKDLLHTNNNSRVDKLLSVGEFA